MPKNQNAWVKELLAWHGHDRAGVQVPFRTRSNPLGWTVETALVRRLRDLARGLAAGVEVPRWVFLVGGPGNGKSQAVQIFLEELDDAFALGGELIRVLCQRYQTPSLVPRKVEVRQSELAGTASEFSTHIGRLIVVQDASASESASGDAAEALVDDIDSLLSGHESPPPVFVCCANRGVLARAIRAGRARESPAASTNLLLEIVQATAVGQAALARQRTPCWPMTDRRAACWPLDLETLLRPSDTAVSPLEQIVLEASKLENWETEERCTGCDARQRCPFRQNAHWMRDGSTRESVLKLLRRGELAAGKRLNFRDAFSLVADLLVGDWVDFPESPHPCVWVHQRVGVLEDGHSTAFQKLESTVDLVARLFPHALFPTDDATELVRDTRDVARSHGREATEAITEALGRDKPAATTYVRSALIGEFARKLDPALHSPVRADELLRRIEDAYNQSVRQGNQEFSPQLSEMERLFMQSLEAAEDEWIDVMGMDAKQVLRVQRLLRWLASTYAKRSLGCRTGSHNHIDYLREYETSLMASSLPPDVRSPLERMLGEAGFRFAATESFGQPVSESRTYVVSLEGERAGISLRPAPEATENSPSHDLPFLDVSGYSLPLTFDLYMALRLSGEGCTSASLPASVRAALDRVRQGLAGRTCRDPTLLSDGRARFRIVGRAILALDSGTHGPVLFLPKAGTDP